MSWQVYILRCANGSYYVGHTRDLATRLDLHNAGKGSAHTAKHRPVTLAYAEAVPDRSAAVKRERQLKKWSRAKKEALILDNKAQLHRLAQCRDLYPMGK